MMNTASHYYKSVLGRFSPQLLHIQYWTAQLLCGGTPQQSICLKKATWSARNSYLLLLLIAVLIVTGKRKRFSKPWRPESEMFSSVWLLCANSNHVSCPAQGSSCHQEWGCRWQNCTGEQHLRNSSLLLHHSLPNQYQEQQHASRQGRERERKTKAKQTTRFQWGKKISVQRDSSTHLSSSASALNESASIPDHIIFVLYKSLWTARRYWAFFDHCIFLNSK